MRTATDISIQRAIIHGVNPHVVGGLTLSEACLPIKRTDPVAVFLANQIQNGLTDQALRAACFTAGNGSQLDVYSKLLHGSANFVATSQNIATRLHDIIKNDRRISVGAIALCYFQAANHTHVKRYLAVLKLDEGDGFQRKTQKDKKGRKYVTLDALRDVMPSTRERLQKCAFVRPLDPRPTDYDLMVLDRQHAANEPAQFFTNDFLTATLASDPGTLTRRFYKAALHGLNSVRTEISQTDFNRVRSAINGAVHSQSIDIDDWTSKLRAPAAARKAIKSAIRDAIPDATIDTDGKVADELTRKRVIRGRYGLKLSFETLHEKEILKTCTPKSDPNKGDYVEIVLNVHDYNEEAR